MAQSQHDRRRCRRPLSGAPLTDRILSRANRSVGPRRNHPPGQIGNGAARLSCGDMPPGKRCRLGPLNPHSKVLEVSNQLGHFINALKQSLSTMKTTHIRNSHTNRQKFSTLRAHALRDRIFQRRRNTVRQKENAASRCAKRPQRLRPTGLNGTRARSDGPCNTVQNRKKLPISKPAEKDQSPKVQADTMRTRLRTCNSNSASVVSWN